MKCLPPTTSVHRLRRPFIAGLGAALLTLASLPAQAFLFGDGQRGGARKECLQRHSKAWCVLDAADMSHKLEDVPRDRLDKALKDSGLSAVDIAYTVGVGTGLLAPAAFMTKWTDISMFLIGSLLEKGPAVVGFNKVLAWMPREMAGSPEAAEELMHQMLFKATREALQPYAFEPSTRHYNPNRPRDFGQLTWHEQPGWELTGPDCPAGQCWLWNQRVGHPRFERPREGPAPEWLGGYRAWVFDLRSGPSIHELWTGQAYESIRYVSALSRQLPAWAYLSITPEHVHVSGTGRPPLRFNPGVRMPMVMHQGQTLLPVFPEVSTVAEGTKP